MGQADSYGQIRASLGAPGARGRGFLHAVIDRRAYRHRLDEHWGYSWRAGVSPLACHFMGADIMARAALQKYTVYCGVSRSTAACAAWSGVKSPISMETQRGPSGA